MRPTVQPPLSLSLTPSLTMREREILGCILQGDSTAEMSRALGVRQSTARTHVRHLLLKLGVSSRLEAAAVATATWSGTGFTLRPPVRSPMPDASDLALVAEVAGRLTEREADVLRGLLQGMTRKAIAQKLRLSPNTVRAHVSNITRKLGCPSALTAVAQVRRWSHPLVDPAGQAQPGRAQGDATGPGRFRTASASVVAAPIRARWENA